MWLAPGRAARRRRRRPRALLARGRFTEAALLALPLLYVTGVHLPLLCETRQSLPVKPIVLVLATIGVARVARSTL